LSGASVFDELWARYDEWFERNRVVAESEARLVEGLVSRRPVVEIGVGTGWFAARVSAEAGVDPSMAMLRVARRRLPGSLLVRGVGERLPFRGASFGTALIVVTLCFVDDPQAVLAEARRVLVEGGEVVACIVPAESPWGRLYMELGRRGHPFYSRARFLTVEEALAAAETAGFKVEGVYGTLRSPPGEAVNVEEPGPYEPGMGFACLKGVNPG